VPKTNSVVDLLDERQLIAIAAAHGIPRLPKVTHIAYKTAPAWRVKARREPKKEPTFETVAKKTKFWDAIFNEVRELVCTKSRKYRKLRQRLLALGGKSQNAIVAAIAVAFADQYGYILAVIIPTVTWCLAAAAAIGKRHFVKWLGWIFPWGTGAK
jgi:hypothetical protein